MRYNNASLLSFQKGTKHLRLVREINVISALGTCETGFFNIIMTISAHFK